MAVTRVAADHSAGATPCAAAVRACRSRSTSSSRAVGAGVSATRRRTRTGQPVCSTTCSRRHARMQARHLQLLRLRVRAHDAEIAHEQRRALRRDAERPPLAAGRSVAERRQERRAAPRRPGGECRMTMKMRRQQVGDLRRAAAAGQPHLRPRVVADHRAVQVAEAIDLRAAEEPDRDAAALQPVPGTSPAPTPSSAPSRTARRRRSRAAARRAASRSCPTRRPAASRGACVSRARLHAADGRPIPTKQTSSSASARAAATVIISTARTSS